MKQVMNYHKDNGLLNMIRRTDPMINLGVKWEVISVGIFLIISTYRISIILYTTLILLTIV